MTMRLTTRLIIGAGVPILMTIFFLGALEWSLDSVAELQEQQAHAIATRNNLGMLNDIARDYLRRGDERSLRQFQTLHEQLVAETRMASQAGQPYERQFTRVAQDLHLVGTLFSIIVDNRAGNGLAAEDGIAQAAEDRLFDQLFLHLLTARATMGELVPAVTEDIVTTQRQVYVTLMIVAVFVGLLASAGLVRTWKSASESLALIRQGTERVGQGDLAYRIGLTKKDELGQLADSFDAMTERLEAVTVSRDELELFIAENMRLLESERVARQGEQLERQRLQTLMDTLPVAVFISDEQGGIVYQNEQAETIWGKAPRGDAEYKGWRRDSGKRLESTDWAGARALRGETVLGETIDIERFDGVRATIINSSVPIRDTEGRVSGQLTVEQDITDRIRLEDQLQRSALEQAALAAQLGAERAQLQAVFDNMAEGVMVLRPDGSFEVNDALAHIHGYGDRNDVIRQPSDHLAMRVRTVDRLDVPVDSWPASRVLQGDSFSGELLEVDVPHTGAHFMGSYSGAPIFDADGSVALGVVTVHAVTELHESARLNEALNEIDACIASTLEVQDIMASVVEMTAEAVGSDCAALYIPVDGVWEAAFTWRVPDWLVGRQLSLRDIPFSADAGRQKRVLSFERPQDHPLWLGSVAQRLGARHVLDAPLLRGDEILGDFGFYRTDESRPFTEGEAGLLAKVAVALSLGLKNAQIYERERHVADTLQEALLTLPDEVEGVEFAHSYSSAAEAARVGGDFYDLFELEGDLLGITIGDVAGKGLDAAVLTSLMKNAIRAQATEPDRTPSAVMSVLNTLVLRSSAPESFATAFFGILNRATGLLVYCNAGHTSVVWSSGGAVVRPLEANSPLVGAFDGVVFYDERVMLGSCDTLFLYTDGLIEARSSDGGFFGEERVYDLVSLVDAEGPIALVASVMDAVVEYSGGALADDLAMIAVRRCKGD
jgi:PAS domain S-box-containing protein